jgi:hypothetical protein
METPCRCLISFVAMWFIVIATVGSLSACGGKPMAFPAPDSELGDRPGLLTGPSGAWTAYQR